MGRRDKTADHGGVFRFLFGSGRKGGNRGRKSNRSADTTRQNKADQRVHRDPDIGGVMRRLSHGPHMRDRNWEIRLNPFKRDKNW